MPTMDQFSADVQSQALMQPQQEAPTPFIFKMMESLPGASSMMALNAGRYSNTAFKGGYLDVADGATGVKSSMKRFFGKRTGAFAGASMQDSSQYALGKKFLGKYAMPRIKAQGMTNLNPIGFGRFDSVARLTGFGMGNKATPYNPFQGISMLVNGAMKLDPVRNRAAARFGSEVLDTQANPLWTGGVFGRIKTADKADDYAKAVSKANDLRSTLGGMPPSRSQRRVLRKGAKAAQRLDKLDDTLVKLGKLTNASYTTSVIDDAMSGLGASGSRAAGMRASLADEMMTTGNMDDAIKSQINAIGRSRALYETMPGQLSKSVFGHYRIMNAGEYSKFADTGVGKRTAQSFANAMEKYKLGSNASGVTNAVDDMGHFMRTAYGGTGYLDDAANVLNSGVKGIRSASGRLAKEAFKAGDKATAARMGGQYLSTYGKAAGKAFSAFGYAQLTYDIGKGIGNMMMGGVNFAKDALKSMQGTINKPIFGAGFKDNEVAATSRARGVMAIQNSRLNARSMLGSEGAMMAAHFG